MAYFEKLNKAWQEAMETEIIAVDACEDLDLVNAFKEYYARYLTEVQIEDKPTQNDIIEIGGSYANFSAGWNARGEKEV